MFLHRLSLAALVFLGILANLGLVLGVMWHYGASQHADFLFAAQAISQTLIQIFSYSLASVLVPQFASQTITQRHWFLWRILAVSLMISSSIALLLAALGEPIFGLMFRDPTLFFQNSFVFFLLLASFIVAVGVSVLSSYLQATRRFVLVETGMAINLVVACATFLFFHPALGMAAYGAGILSGTVVQFSLLFFVIEKHAPSAGDWGAIKDCGKRLIPIWASSGITKSDVLVDRMLASWTGPGALSMLHYAQQISSLLSYAMMRVFLVPVLPTWATSRHVYPLIRNLVPLLLKVGFVAFAMSVLAAPYLLVYVLNMDIDGPLLTLVLVLLFGHFFGGIIGQAYVSAFHSKGDTITPSKIGVVGYFIGVIIRLLGLAAGGLQGLAIGISMYYLMNLAFLHTAFVYKHHHES